MQLEQIVVTLELAKKLKETGYPQESLFYYEFDLDETEIGGDIATLRFREDCIWLNTDDSYSAPTATELLNELPEVIVVKNKVHSFWCNKIDGLYRCGYDENCYEEYGFQEDDKSMANAMAKLYLELKKEGLL